MLIVKSTVKNWIKDGKYRILVLKYLASEDMLSSELADKLGTHRSSTSRILKSMEKKRLIKKITSRSRTVTYTITKSGREYLKKLGGAK